MKQIKLFKRHCPDVVLTVLQMPVDSDCRQIFQISVTACVSFPNIKNFEDINAFLKKLKHLEPRQRRNCLSTEQLRGLSID